MLKRGFLTVALLAGVSSVVTAAAGPLLAGVDKSGIDASAKPGDGFDRYANGAWRAKATIPPDRAAVGVGYDVDQIAEARDAEIVRAAATANPPAGGDQRKIADYYAAYLDTAAIDAKGVAVLATMLKGAGSIADKHALSKTLGMVIRADVDPLNATNLWTENLFGLFITQDLNRPAVTVPYVLQGGLGLPDRDYYLSDKPDMAAIRVAYRAYVVKLFTMLGLDGAEARADHVLALENKIARAHWTIVDSGDAHKANNPWRRADFAAKAPGIDWDAFWTAASLPDQQEFIVWQPSAITGLSALVASEPIEEWRDWLIFHRVNQVASVMPRAFDDAHFDFYGRTLSGVEAQLPRERRAVRATSGALGDAIGKTYAQKYFPASSRAEIQGMARNIVAAFDARLAKLTWLAPTTRAEARRKLAVLRVGVGYPDTWRDYAALDVKPGDAMGNLLRYRIYEYHHQLAKLGKPVDRDEWWMTPQTVNAVNLPLQNALNFPAAILETPYFDARFDAAANYGAIGAIIGHEISHSFDNLGADFDSTGKLRSWWTPADYKHFEAQTAALARQYDGYEALPGLHLNGRQELGENIADTAGLTAAYEAYHKSLGGKPAPVIDGLTGDQRFFLAFAQAWRTKMRDASLRGRVATDAHAPPMWRVETVRNLDAWYAAFGAKPGQALYLPPADRVHIW